MVELGAGVGRFTAELAQRAAQVIAVDFVEDVIRKVIFQMQPWFVFFLYFFFISSQLF